jgi:hypothetical protein
VEAPVDFSDLSLEYIGIMYEGLLDFELRQAAAEESGAAVSPDPERWGRLGTPAQHPPELANPRHDRSANAGWMPVCLPQPQPSWSETIPSLAEPSPSSPL